MSIGVVSKDSGSEVVFEMAKVTKRFPGVVALSDMGFQLRKGEVHVLLGENGAGKSTLIKILTGAHVPDEGQLYLNGEEIKITDPIHAQRLGISAVYQEFNLVPDLDVGKNIFLGRELIKGTLVKTLNRKEIYRKSGEFLTMLGSRIDLKTPVSQLGVASQQIVEIAKALVSDARILILDEPSAVLTDDEITKLFEVIQVLKARGVSIIYISHRLDEIKKIGDRATVIRDGKYIQTVDFQEEGYDIDHLIQLMVGRKITETFPKQKVEPGKEILRVRNLNRKGVLKDISFELKAGEILGISGLVGAGRTEIAKAIFGADKIDGGDILVHGNRVVHSCPHDAIAHRIGLVPEDRKAEGLVQVLPVDSNMILANTEPVTTNGILDMKKKKTLVGDFVKSLRIVTPSIGQKVMNLSGGNQQKVVLAKWLVSNSDIIIFDEPTRGIDVGAKVEVYQLMNELVKKGAGIIMISSELPEILGMSDRILVVREGSIVAEIPREAATQENILYHAAGGNRSDGN